MGLAWELFGVLFSCLFWKRFLTVFLICLHRCRFCEDVVLDAEPCVFLCVFDMAALLECFGSPRNLHQTRHKNLWKINEIEAKILKIEARMVPGSSWERSGSHFGSQGRRGQKEAKKIGVCGSPRAPQKRQ